MCHIVKLLGECSGNRIELVSNITNHAYKCDI